MRVRLRGDNPTFFAKIVGVNSMPWETYAVAAHRPRDVAIILDFSGSMSFGSQFSWDGGWSGGTVYGTQGADPVYPRFGHYWRYTQYSSSAALTSANATSGTVGNRPNPLSAGDEYDLGANGTQGVSNLTVETASGPPLILDFRMDASNVATPATPVTTPGTLWNAFNRWMKTTPAVENLFLDPAFRPTVTSTFDTGVYVNRTFNWTGYNAFDTTNTSGPTPAPDSFRDQSDADATYVGDRFPRKGGLIYTTATTWDTTTVTGAARNVQVLLSKATAGDTTLFPLATRTTAPTTVPSGYTFPLPGGDGGTTWNNFRDDLWERYGYDLDVARYSGTVPSSSNRAAAALRTTNLFQGYSMGPGYYGKTFFMWPPDPRFTANADVKAPSTSNPAFDTSGRAMCDWRRRFFYRSGFTEANATAATPTGRFDPQIDNDTATTGTQNINQVLLNATAGTGTLNPTTTGYRVNYRAILAWLKTGPQVLPPNLRAGRILYYSSIPDDVDDLTNLDKRFWRDYIDYVLGYTGNTAGAAPGGELAGNENRVWPEGGSLSISSTAASGTNPLPYLSYTDVPNMPRMHFWFGPLTMLGFIGDRDGSYGWLAGTTHQAQCWQLKAGMNSALDDIKNNHPNDFCSLVYFANYNFQTPRVTMGQNWTRLKNALFYPYSLLPTIEAGNTTTELRPYNSSLGDALVGNLPNPNGGTDPVSGFAQAFNTLTWSTAAYNARTSPNNTSANGGSGRRGAAKLVIYETDGVPNGRPAWTYTNGGTDNAYWQEGGSNPGSSAADDSIQVVNRMVLQQGSGGLSLPNNTCKVHCLAFGDLFATPYSTAAQNGLVYLLNVQKAGGTSPATATAYTDFPTNKIINGTYTNRIANLRTALEQIMQSGIQVTLVQ